MGSPQDRLAALRQPPPVPMTKQVNRTHLLIGSAVALVVVLGVVWVMGGGDRSSLAPAVVDVPTTAAPMVLLEGEALISVAAEMGAFPPDLRPGDGVRVVVSPFFGTESLTRALPQTAIVHAVETPREFTQTHVVTLRGPESMAVDIADSERVRLAIVSKAP